MAAPYEAWLRHMKRFAGAAKHEAKPSASFTMIHHQPYSRKEKLHGKAKRSRFMLSSACTPPACQAAKALHIATRKRSNASSFDVGEHEGGAAFGFIYYDSSSTLLPKGEASWQSEAEPLHAFIRLHASGVSSGKSASYCDAQAEQCFIL